VGTYSKTSTETSTKTSTEDKKSYAGLQANAASLPGGARGSVDISTPSQHTTAPVQLNLLDILSSPSEGEGGSVDILSSPSETLIAVSPAREEKGPTLHPSTLSTGESIPQEAYLFEQPESHAETTLEGTKAKKPKRQELEFESKLKWLEEVFLREYPYRLQSGGKASRLVAKVKNNPKRYLNPIPLELFESGELTLALRSYIGGKYESYVEQNRAEPPKAKPRGSDTEVYCLPFVVDPERWFTQGHWQADAATIAYNASEIKKRSLLSKLKLNSIQSHLAASQLVSAIQRDMGGDPVDNLRRFLEEHKDCYDTEKVVTQLWGREVGFNQLIFTPQVMRELIPSFDTLRGIDNHAGMRHN